MIRDSKNKIDQLKNNKIVKENIATNYVFTFCIKINNNFISNLQVLKNMYIIYLYNIHIINNVKLFCTFE